MVIWIVPSKDHTSKEMMMKFLLGLNQMELNTSHTIKLAGTA